MFHFDDDWQQEFEKVKKQLESIYDSHTKSIDPWQKKLLLQKAELSESQKKLSALIQKFQNIPKPGPQTTKQQYSIMLWGKKIAEMLDVYFDKYCHSTNQWMWLALIKSQLTGGSQLAHFDDLDIVELSNRVAALKKVEKSLAEQSEKLAKQKEGLVLRYQTYLTCQTNASAAATLQTDLSRDRQTLDATGNYLKWLTMPMRDSTETEKRRNRKQQALGEKSQSLLSYCRSLLNPSGEVKVVMGEQTIRNIGNNLHKIQQLREEVAVLNEKIIEDIPSPQQPIVLKKTQRKDKYLGRL